MQALIEADLVDEVHLMVFPVVLGTGRRLFGETSEKSDENRLLPAIYWKSPAKRGFSVAGL